jgi:Tfp pilus assembly protein PilZ
VAVKPVGEDERFEALRQSGEGLLQNISGGGVCVRMPSPVKEGALLALTIQLPSLPTSVIALGKVVWATPMDEGCDAGIEFWWVGWEDPSTQEKIRSFISETLTNNPGPDEA